MCGNMVDSQCATADNRGGKKEERRNHRSKTQCRYLIRKAAIIKNKQKNFDMTWKTQKNK